MNSSYLCIDIGINSIKVLEKDSEGVILRWGILERKDNFHSSIQPINPKDVAQELRRLLDEMKVDGKSAVFSLPAFYIFTAISDLLDPKIVPALPTTYKLSGWLLSDSRYFMSAVPLEIIDKYKEICRLASLEFDSVVSESEAIAAKIIQYKERVLVASVDKRLTTFTVINKGKVEYIFYTDFGSASEALDVIMNKTREVAKKNRAEKILFSNSVFNTANGLSKISQQAFNGYSFGRSVRSSY